MKATYILSIVGLALGSAIVQRNGCHADNCAREVTGTRPGLLPITSRQADCSRFQTATVTPAPRTVTVTGWVGPSGVNKKRWIDLQPRQVTVIPTAVPTYAPHCDASEYASACSCWGFNATTRTVRAPRVTVTTITTAGDCTSFALAAVPSCAHACLEAAAPQVGCGGLTDLPCLCVPAVVGALYEVVPACVAEACPASVIGAIDAGVSNACGCHTAASTVGPTATPTPVVSTTASVPACQT